MRITGANYDTALICLNGHMTNSKSKSEPEHNAKHCSVCGELTIPSCPSCNSDIRGDFLKREGYDRWRKCGEPASHCHNCGKPYPWTIRRSEALAETLDELDELSLDERTKLKQSIPDTLAETPKSGTAVLLFKKAIAKLGAVGGKVLTDVLAKVASEAVKKSMGL